MSLNMLKFRDHSMKQRKSLTSLIFIVSKLMLAPMISCCTQDKTKIGNFVRNVKHQDGKQKRNGTIGGVISKNEKKKDSCKGCTQEKTKIGIL